MEYMSIWMVKNPTEMTQQLNDLAGLGWRIKCKLGVIPKEYIILEKENK